MQTSQPDTLATLRAVVGYLGERERYGWWQSAFFGAGSAAFLSPVFTRTRWLAQITGVTRAAAAIHDERIGVGEVYHLFRLPEEMEHGIHRALRDDGLCADIAALVSGKEAALNYLRQQAGAPARPGIGPVRAGGIRELLDIRHWPVVAAHYARAFDQAAETYPYFADRT